VAKLTDDGKLLVLYLLTCEHNTLVGVFRLSDGYISDDLGWERGKVQDVFAELAAKGFAERCDQTKWVWIRNYLRENPPENPNQMKAAAKITCRIPTECEWRQRFFDIYRNGFETLSKPLSNPFETLSKPLSNPFETVPELPETVSKPFPDASETVSKQGEGEVEVEGKESTPPTPPKGGRRGGRRGTGVAAEVFPEADPLTIELVNWVCQTTPVHQPDGAEIRVVAGMVLERIEKILKGNSEVTHELLREAYGDYLASKPRSYKAPQYFFGEEEHQGPNGAHWRTWARAVYLRWRHQQASSSSGPSPPPGANQEQQGRMPNEREDE
jgi:hypothetical protein